MRRLCVLAALLSLLTGSVQAADSALTVEANQAYLANNAKQPGWHVMPSGVQFKIVQNGFGKRPAATDTVQVYYTGKLINGTVFDGTSPGLPASFKVGDVIPGWSLALQIMREGDHWELVIPSNLAYGSQGRGEGLIPPNQTLVFDLRLVSTTPAPKKGEKGYVPDPGDKDDEQQ